MLMVGKHSVRTLLALLAVFLIASTAAAAEKATPGAAIKGPAPAQVTYDDPLGRSTPQGTVVGFLKAMQREDHEQAVEYLDTRQTGKKAQQLAVELNYILDQGMTSTVSALSTRPEGNLKDDLPTNRELVGAVKMKTGNYKILLDRVERENNHAIWLFSPETLKLVHQIYDELGTPWIEQYVPNYLTETRVAGFPVYRLLFSLFVLPLALVFGWLITWLLLALMRKPIRHRFDEQLLRKLSRAKIPLRLIFAAVAVYLFSRGALSLIAQLFWNFVASTMAVIGLTWLFLHLIDVGAETVERRGHEAGSAVVRLTATLLKTLTVVAGLFVIFHFFAGINLTAVVAGLGVGGIAVAFAAQKTIENFFGGVFLVWDKPIRLGDFCKAGEYSGTVEHIGLRSTQIRTLNRTVVSIPNGQLSTISVENFTLRDRFLLRHTLNLRYETTADQLRCILVEIRELLYRHPRVDSTTVRIRFIGFGETSLDVEIFAYVLETTYESFLAVQEDLLFRIMGIVEANGSGFAFPSQTLYMSRDSGLDAEKSSAAAATVGRWKDQGDLPFPEHAPGRIAQLDNTLEYPPRDSAVHGKKDGGPS